MKIALVTDSLDEHAGSRAAISLACALHNQGVDVSIFVSDDLYSKETEARLTSLGIKASVVKRPLLNVLGRFLSKIPLGFKTAILINKEKYDLISFHGSPETLVGLRILTRLPIVTTYYGTQITDTVLKRLITKLRASLWVYLSNNVVAISKYCCQELADLFGYSKAPVIYPGIESAVTSKWGSGSENFRHDGISILSVSRFVPYKGFLELIEILRNLVSTGLNVRATLAGNPADKKYYEEMKRAVKDLPITIVINPTDEELASLYLSCDVYVSGSRWEGFGLTYLEASSYGKPALGLRKASVPEVIEDSKTGYLCNNFVEVERRLRELTNNLPLRAELGEAGRSFSLNFSWKSAAAAYISLFKETLTTKNGK